MSAKLEKLIEVVEASRPKEEVSKTRGPTITTLIVKDDGSLSSAIVTKATEENVTTVMSEELSNNKEVLDLHNQSISFSRETIKVREELKKALKGVLNG